MNGKLKVVITIQAVVVAFLLGILLGMNIQKKRMNADSKESTSAGLSQNVDSDAQDTDKENRRKRLSAHLVQQNQQSALKYRRQTQSGHHHQVH